MKIDGACHCGNIKYEADIDPDKVAICHCTDCQVLSGTAYRVVVYVSSDRVSFSGSEPRIYVKTAESGNPRHQVFCPECGTQLYATSAEAPPKILGIRLGTARQFASLPPKKQVWCRSALSWVSDVGLIPGVEKQ